MIANSKVEFTVNSRKFDGSLRRSWRCKLIRERPPELLFYGRFEHDVDHAELGNIERGTHSFEYYWLDRWYSVFCFFEPDGRFRNHYVNINMPPVLGREVVDFVDLDIDFVVWPDGTYKVLDEDEFEMHSAALGYTTDVINKVAESVSEVVSLIRDRRLPDAAQFLGQI